MRFARSAVGAGTACLLVVVGFIDHFVFHNQLVLRIDRALHVVTDLRSLPCMHQLRIRVSGGNLLVIFVQLSGEFFVIIFALLELRDFLFQFLARQRRGRRPRLLVSVVEVLQILGNLRVDPRDEFLELLLVEVFVFGV